MSSTPGKFLNFLLDYSQMSDDDQAKSILDKADQLIKGGSTGVSITYSANYGQTVEIEKTYLAEEWDTKTNGANQATVVHDMLKMMATSAYSHLQGKMRLAPITTMAGSTKYAQKITTDESFHLGIIATDLMRIKNSLETGWSVLGWQNQKTVNSVDHPYAVGGGVVKLSAPVNKMIQGALMQYHTDFS
ncbi:hypothetical protein N9B82_02350 [Saprospiraceae bacterium]|nr:hypothetical protein [Saprospiraceae bacterium]